MAVAPDERRTDRGLDRVVAFSDGVVAIAITLLVLPLLDMASDRGDFGELMSASWPRLIAFVVSFAVVANFWLIHHRVFELVGSVSGPLIWANMLWLATIAFLPFPTEILGVRDSSEMGVRALYIGAVAACSLALAVVEVVILRDPALWPDGVRPDIDIVRAAAILGAMALAFVLGVFVEPIGMWAMLLLAAVWPISRWLSLRAARPSDVSATP